MENLIRKFFPIEPENPCRMCDKWTPSKGCKHYLPDSETILKEAGYRIYKPGINTRQKKFIVANNEKTHKFESLAKAARILIHENASREVR